MNISSSIYGKIGQRPRSEICIYSSSSLNHLLLHSFCFIDWHHDLKSPHKSPVFLSRISLQFPRIFQWFLHSFKQRRYNVISVDVNPLHIITKQHTHIVSTFFIVLHSFLHNICQTRLVWRLIRRWNDRYYLSGIVKPQCYLSTNFILIRLIC